LNNNFLTGLQHFGNQLRAAMLFVARVPVPRRLVRTPAGAAPTALRAIAAAHGSLEARAWLLGDASSRRRLRRARLLRFGGRVQILVPFCGFALMKFAVLYFMLGVVFIFVRAIFVRSEMQGFVLFPVFGSGVGGHGDFVHFVGEGIGIVLRLFMVGIAIGFMITFVIGFVIGIMIRFVLIQIGFRVRVERILQILKLGGFDKRFGNGLNRLGTVFGNSLRFLVLGFSELFGERGDFFIGKSRTSLRVNFG
jgi:hypothetical protein